jgi:hypothetical protein
MYAPTPSLRQPRRVATDNAAGGANSECYARTGTGPRWGQNRGEQWGQFRSSSECYSHTRRPLPDNGEGDQPWLLRRLRALPWRQIGPAARGWARGHGRVETRTISVVALHPIPDFEPSEFFPHAAQAIKLVRRRRALTGRCHTATVYAITSLPAWQADRFCWPAGSTGTGASRTSCTGSATSPSTRTVPRSAPARGRRSWPCCPTSLSTRYAWPAPATSPLACATTPATADAPSSPTRSRDNFAGTLTTAQGHGRPAQPHHPRYA